MAVMAFLRVWPQWPDSCAQNGLEAGVEAIPHLALLLAQKPMARLTLPPVEPPTVDPAMPPDT
ncbi:MAG: hypothetical protein N2Z59_04300 [Alteraurantiacibacter sp.]|nr:hypothetical protein [Alteraurantiacibacter sp.]